MASHQRTDGVEVRMTGLTEFVGALRQVDRNLPRELRRAFYQVAKAVTLLARSRMEFGPGEAANSLRPVAGSDYVGISHPAGGAPWQGVKADYEPWLDFGGTTGRGHSSGAVHSRRNHSQEGRGAIYRDKIKGGRYLYPAISESTEAFKLAASDAVATAAREAGFDVGGTAP